MPEIRLIILQTAIPDYRKKVFRVIKDQLGSNFFLYGGSEYFEMSVETDPSMSHIPVKNRFFFGRRLLWQEGVKHLTKEKGVLVMELNPRILSNWYLLLSRKRKRLPTVLWGHAWPRSGKNSKSDVLRNQMRKLSDTIIVYTKKQASELKRKMPLTEIIPAPNAVFLEKDVSPVSTEDPKNIIYVGRLTKAKKPLFLVKAFINAIQNLPEDSNLIIVGEGDERDIIEKYISDHSMGHRIKILGHVSDFENLKQLYASSLVSVSPGYVGLSITQSFSFGVPMLISRDEPHSPEIEAAIEKENALFFETENLEDFKNILYEVFEYKSKWTSKRSEISEYCKKNYTVETMAAVFINLAKRDGI